jgi:hypothetical protein
VKKYPDLMLFHTKLNYPVLAINKKNFAEWTKDLNSNWKKQSYTVIGYISASQSIEEILTKQEEAIVAAIGKKFD